MRWLDNLKVANKVLLVVGLLAIALVGITLFASQRMMSADAAYSVLLDKKSKGLVMITRANRRMAAAGYGAYSTIVHDGASNEAHAAALMARESLQQSDRLLDETKALNPDYGTAVDGFRTRLDAIAPLIDDAVRRGLVNDNAAASKQMDKADQALFPLLADVAAFTDTQIKLNQAASDALAEAAQRTRLLMWIAGGFGLLIAGGAGIWIGNRRIAAPLRDLAGRMQTLASGDLSVEVEGQDRKDEVGLMAKSVQVFKDNGVEMRRLETEAEAQRQAAEQERVRQEAVKAEAARELAVVVEALAKGLRKLADGELTYRVTEDLAAEYRRLGDDFNGAIGQLQDAMRTIQDASRRIGSGSDEISSAAGELSSRTEQQAASLEETAAALDEITATVKKTAEGAKEAKDFVATARADAESSGEVVREAVDAMSQIERSAQQIAQIIGVIDEIAFQTNLLALNAGVEAARAGDAGKGFAVVASEVRALAQRSADAAKEIKTLISESSNQVERGVQLVGQTGEALTRIVTRVSEMSGVVGEIAVSAQEQSSSLQQVNTAVNQMDQVTQQNAAMAEESTAASQSLANEAQALGEMIARFDVGAPSASAAPPRPAEAPPSPARTRMRMVAGALGATVPSGAEDWSEF